MGKCFIISIGGTGARVMKSIFHLCAAGCLDEHEFNVMCVDSDNSNGDKAVLETTQLAYKNLSKFRIFPHITISFWSPLNTRSKTMAEMVNRAHMSDRAKDMFDFFYTQKEQSQKLEGGFYGHTSIGSYFVSNSIFGDGDFKSPWKEFFGGTLTENDKVFIIGSIFGGTGASGIPTLSKIIKGFPDTSSARIGAVFVTPYFKPVGKTPGGESIEDIDWRLFTTKVRSALAFYKDQNFSDIFQTIYFVGEKKDQFMAVKKENSGVRQRNKSNHIELMAAACLSDFMVASPSEEFTAKLYEDKGSNVTRLNTVNGCEHLFDKLASFLKFSILHVKYFHPGINNPKAIAQGWIHRKKYGHIDKEDSKLIYDYCKLLIEWAYEVGVATSASTGDFPATDDLGIHEKNYGISNANLFKTSQIHAPLYHMSALQGLIGKGSKYNLSMLDPLRDIVVGDDINNSSILTGEEIIRSISTGSYKIDNSANLMVDFMQRVQSLCFNRRGVSN